MTDTLQERLRKGIHISGKGDIHDDAETLDLMDQAADALDALIVALSELADAAGKADECIPWFGSDCDGEDYNLDGNIEASEALRAAIEKARDARQITLARRRVALS